MQIGQEIEDHLSGPEIQVSGWLVGQQNRRIGDQGTSQRNPLLFAPGQLPGAMPGACCKPNLLQPRPRSRGRLRVRPAANQQRHHHVFQSGKLWQQIVNLPDETNFTVPKIRQI